jgi:hypothetical protein
LLNHLGIRKAMRRYDHASAEVRERILGEMAEKSVVLVSDAGTPLISDPGYRLVREARERGLAVTSLPGPSAMIVALTLAGLPTDRFMFAGFLPSKDKARGDVLAELPQRRPRWCSMKPGRAWLPRSRRWNSICRARTAVARIDQAARGMPQRHARGTDRALLCPSAQG